MNKHLLALAAIAGCGLSCQGQNVLQAQVEGATSADKAYTAVFDEKGFPVPVDSAQVDDNGNFTLKTNLWGTDVLIVTLPKEDKLEMGRGAFRGKLFGMFLEGKKGTYRFFADKDAKTVISGGIYDDPAWADIKKATLERRPYAELQKAQDEFAAKNPSKYAYNAYFMSSRLREGEMPPDKASAAFEKFDPSVKQSRYGKVMKQAMADMQKSSAGQPAPALTITDKDGKTLSLSDYRGKYVLLEFWGSWCGPCRASNPKLKTLYDQYHDKGFEIVSLACRESSEKNWLAAIEKDGMTWTQANTSTQKNGATGREIMEEYGINYFPQSVLINPEGTILKRGHVGDIMQEILRIFEKK